MTATLTTAASIIKVRYAKGKVPKLLYGKVHAKLFSLMTKEEDFTGDPWHISLQNENPQNSGGTFGVAQNVTTPGSYKAFDISSVVHYSFARITGAAMRKVEGNDGAMLDLWQNEMDGAAMTEILDFEVHCHGNGTGVRGQVLSGGAGTTLTLTEPTDIAKFFVGMKLIAVSSDTSLSPTYVSQTGATAPDATGSNCNKISSIDRKLGTITLSAAFFSNVNNLYLCRAGEEAGSGAAKVMTGVKGFVAYDSSVGLPGTLFGLNRDLDPVRFAGNVIDGSGSSLEDIIVDGSSEVVQQGGTQPTLCLMNPKRMAKFRKELSAKLMYTRKNMDTPTGGASFSGVEIYGDEEPITCATTPFLNQKEAELLHLPSWKLKSAGATPRILDFDSNTFLRLTSADEYEVRWGAYPAIGCNNPLSQVRFKNFGA